MTQISVSDLKVNAGKYVSLAQEEDIFITKNGKVVAKLVTAKLDKEASWNRLTEMFRGVSLTDDDVEKIREERLDH